MSELILHGGLVVDGSGGPPRRSDVVVDGDRIARVEPARRLRPGDRAIDADGLAVAPGFIDLHSHADFTLPAYPDAPNSLAQGVTTEVLGNCGYSPAPLSDDPERRAAQLAANAGLGPDLAWDWGSFAEFAERLDAARPAVNAALLVGHGQLRLGVVGPGDRPATAIEIAAMRVLVADALAAGAFGMSTGLVYPPGSYAGTDEIVAVGEPLRGGRGLYASHIRSEGHGLADALAEAVEIGRRLDTRVEVSHLKAAGRPNHGRAAEALAILDRAREDGIPVGVDAYPYTAGATLLTQLLPPWAQDGGTDALVERLRDPATRTRIAADVATGLPGWMSYAATVPGWDAIRISTVRDRSLAHLEGLTIDEAAAAAGTPPLELVFDTLVADRGAPTMIVELMDSADVEAVLRHPATAIGSDQLGVTSPDARVHPRAYGTFARILGWAVRERGLLTLEEAVRRMTSLPAAVLGLGDRGRVAPGMVADLVVFDPASVTDQSTAVEPTRAPVGIEAVLLGGRIAVERGSVMDARLGRVLRRRG